MTRITEQFQQGNLPHQLLLTEGPEKSGQTFDQGFLVDPKEDSGVWKGNAEHLGVPWCRSFKDTPLVLVVRWRIVKHGIIQKDSDKAVDTLTCA